MPDQPRYEHPLALGQEQRPSSGVDVRLLGLSTPNEMLQLPREHGEHSWVAKVLISVPGTLLARGAIPFDPRSLVGIDVYCWVCERDVETPEMLTGPCLGDKEGRYIPTRREFEAWDKERQVAWLDTLNLDRDE